MEGPKHFLLIVLTAIVALVIGLGSIIIVMLALEFLGQIGETRLQIGMIVAIIVFVFWDAAEIVLGRDRG
jgi:hypothetical protein